MIPEPSPQQRLLPLSEDTSIMSARQLSNQTLKGLYLMLEMKFGDPEDHPDVAPALHIARMLSEAWESSVAGKLQISSAVMKTIPSVKQEDIPEKQVLHDIPWLNRSRLAYKDPERLAAVRAENAGVVVDIESREIRNGS